MRAAEGNRQRAAGNVGGRAAEWPTLYSQYLLRVASQSAEMLELYQEVMERVAAQELAPTVLQDMQPRFARARGAEYSNQFAEITMRFFTEMVRLGSTSAAELRNVIVPGAEQQPLEPPELNVADPLFWYQQLNEYMTELNARTADTYQSLFERLSSGELSSGELQEISSNYAEQRFPDLLRRLSTAYFDLLNGLNDLYTGYQQEFLRGVLSTLEDAEAEGAFMLRLSAPLDETASATVSLTNTTDAPTTLRSALSSIRRADGVGPAFDPDATITPDSLDLQPGEEARLTVALKLDAERFEADRSYVGDLQITAHGEPRFEIPLRITASPSPRKVAPDSSD